MMSTSKGYVPGRLGDAQLPHANRWLAFQRTGAKTGLPRPRSSCPPGKTTQRQSNKSIHLRCIPLPLHTPQVMVSLVYLICLGRQANGFKDFLCLLQIPEIDERLGYYFNPSCYLYIELHLNRSAAGKIFRQPLVVVRSGASRQAFPSRAWEREG